MNEIKDDFGNWFAGFTDGEGCFGIFNRNCENPRTNCVFTINLRVDDRPILEEIRNMLKIGTIHNKPPRICDTHTTQAQSRFQVHAITECAELVKVFEKYPLRAKKQKDFLIWKQAVAELQKPVDCRDPLMLDYWYHKIREVRQYEPQAETPKPQIKSLQLTIEFH